MKRIVLFLSLLSTLFITGCTAKIKVELKENGTVSVDFKGGTGENFKKMLQSTNGGEVVFDTEEINYQLVKSGFSGVKIETNNTDLHLSMVDEKKKSYLFESGLVQETKKGLTVNINRDNLAKFYSSADEQVVQILDLFLAPVFNDESMTEKEYLEVIGSFYGDGMEQEIAESIVEITVVSPGNKSTTSKIPMTKLLCLEESITLHSSNL